MFLDTACISIQVPVQVADLALVACQPSMLDRPYNSAKWLTGLLGHLVQPDDQKHWILPKA